MLISLYLMESGIRRRLNQWFIRLSQYIYSSCYLCPDLPLLQGFPLLPSHPLLIDNALDGRWLTATDMLSRGDPLADICSLSLCTLGADNYAHDDATSLRSSFCAVDV
jgi:hypothetical protein